MKIVKNKVLPLLFAICSYASISNGQEEQIAEKIQVKPKISANKVAFGDKSLIMDEKGHWSINAGGKRILRDSYYIKIAGVKNGIGVDDNSVVYDKKFNYNKDEKKFTYSCKFPTGENGVGVFTRTVKLVADDLLQVDIKSAIPETVKVSYQHITFMFPFTVCADKTIIVNGKPKQFSKADAPNTAKAQKVFSGKVKSILFTPEKISTSFKMKLSTKNYCSIKENRNGRRAAMVVIRISPDKNGEISYLLNLK